eukprot:g21749.t1
MHPLFPLHWLIWVKLEYLRNSVCNKLAVARKASKMTSDYTFEKRTGEKVTGATLDEIKAAWLAGNVNVDSQVMREGWSQSYPVWNFASLFNWPDVEVAE